jgi:hypothetical protein
MTDPDSFIKQHKQKLLRLQSDHFEEIALEVFQFQAQYNPVYKKYIQVLGRNPEQIHQITEIPFLPIEFFKTQEVLTNAPEIQQVFESSGTTGQIRSRHLVADTHFYEVLSKQIFESFYGKLTDFHVLALLPSYLERQTSSLVFMADFFIRESQSPHSGFYLYDTDALLKKIEYLKNQPGKILLLGVTFALLDLAEDHKSLDLSDCIVMETGGMKGRRREMIREEVHDILRNGLNVNTIHSEYGMTELLSQGYSKGSGIFRVPPSMKILIREINDPFAMSLSGRNGGVNVIDLANIESCSFIETQDLGSVVSEEEFTIIGRFDNSEIRGCSLMVV